MKPFGLALVFAFGASAQTYCYQDPVCLKAAFDKWQADITIASRSKTCNYDLKYGTAVCEGSGDAGIPVVDSYSSQRFIGDSSSIRINIDPRVIVKTMINCSTVDTSLPPRGEFLLGNNLSGRCYIEVAPNEEKIIAQPLTCKVPGTVVKLVGFYWTCGKDHLLHKAGKVKR